MEWVGLWGWKQLISKESVTTNCKNCSVVLTEENVSWANKKIGKRRSMCKPCRSKETVSYQKNNKPARREYANKYARNIGKVKQYPCLTCSALCYKKYAKAFCSDKCRFMSYVNMTESCWLWIGTKNRSGYGKLSFLDNNHDTAHRVSYKLFNGPIIDNLFVCHTCDNPSCVKPDHLWLGTALENKMDQINKSRGGQVLKPKDILFIRSLYDKGLKCGEISRLLSVNYSTVYAIVKRLSWNHLE